MDTTSIIVILFLVILSALVVLSMFSRPICVTINNKEMENEMGKLTDAVDALSKEVEEQGKQVNAALSRIQDDFNVLTGKLAAALADDEEASRAADRISTNITALQNQRSEFNNLDLDPTNPAPPVTEPTPVTPTEPTTPDAPTEPTPVTPTEPTTPDAPPAPPVTDTPVIPAPVTDGPSDTPTDNSGTGPTA